MAFKNISSAGLQVNEDDEQYRFVRNENGKYLEIYSKEQITPKPLNEDVLLDGVLSIDETKVLNNYDRFTGVQFNADKVTNWIDGTPMDDSKVDNIIYFKNSDRIGGYSKRSFDGSISAEWFGVNTSNADNKPYIDLAIQTVNSFGGGEITFKNGVYLTSAFNLMQGVNFTGSTFQPSGTQSPLVSSNVPSGTTLKCIEVTDLFIGYVPDNTFTSQLGLESGLFKSNPKSCIKNFVIDSNSVAKIGLELFEAWGNSLKECQLINAKSYNLSVFDCNEFLIQDCAITSMLNYSGADFIIQNCDIQGTDSLPALYNGFCANGVVGDNKLFFSPLDKNPLNIKVVSLDADGLFSLERQEIGDPGWLVSPTGSTSGSFTYDEPTDTLDITSFNGQQFAVVSSLLARLDKQSAYKITFSVKLLDASVSTTRTLRYTCGNEGQTYGTTVLTRGVDTPVSQTFVFNPANPATNPIKFLVNAKTGVTGDDIIEIVNLDIEPQDLGTVADKTPFVLYSDTAQLPTDMIPNFNFTIPYYIKFLSATTFKLAVSRKDWDDGVFSVPTIAIPTITGLYVAPPKSVYAIIGASSSQGVSNNVISTGNKIEDIRTSGLLCRGVYGYNFTGNNITKGINETGTPNSFCVRLEYGSTENVFSGGFIGNRYLVSAVDRVASSIYIDSTSYRNNFSGIATGTGSRDIGVIDDFIGQSFLSNVYNGVTNNTYCDIARSSDYVPNSNATVFAAGIINNVQGINGVIADSEFTLAFSDLMFQTSTGDSVFFKQNIPSTTTSGRVEIKRNLNGALIITVTSTIVYQSANGVLVEKIPYDVYVCRNIGYGYSVYVNGDLITPASTATLANVAPTGSTVRTYIGSDVVIADTFSLTRFRYFSDILSVKEIKTLFSSGFLDNDCLDTPAILNQATDNISATGTIDLTLTDSSTSGYLSTKGTTIDVLSSLHELRINNLSGTTQKPLRFSFYAKTSTTDVIEILTIRRSRVLDVEDVGSGFSRFTVLAFPDLASNDLYGSTIRFGKEKLEGFSFTFVPASTGSVVISTMKIYDHYLPNVVDVDLTLSLNGVFKNRFTTNFTTWTLLNNGSLTGIKDITITGDIKATTDGSSNIGSSSVQFASVYTINARSKSGSPFEFGSDGPNSVFIKVNNTRYWKVDGTTPDFYPVVDNTRSLGNSSFRIANIFTTDLRLGITGLLKGGGAGANVSAAVAGTDYVTPANVTTAINALNVTSGTYTPTITNGANTSALTLLKAHYTRVGNEVTVTGAFALSVTSALTASGVNITLPIASNLASIVDLVGVGQSVSGTQNGITITGDTTFDFASLVFISSATTGSGQTIMFSFTYTVI